MHRTVQSTVVCTHEIQNGEAERQFEFINKNRQRLL